MAVVTINITSEAVIIDPATVNINREDQTIIWKLQGGTWDSNGIVFNMNPPAPLVPWRGGQAFLNTDGDFEVEAGIPLPSEVHTSQLYAYTINARDTQNNPRTGVISMVAPTGYTGPEVVTLTDGTGVIEVDPGIENQPVP